jgi:hypothetical protein
MHRFQHIIICKCRLSDNACQKLKQMDSWRCKVQRVCWLVEYFNFGWFSVVWAAVSGKPKETADNLPRWFVPTADLSSFRNLIYLRLLTVLENHGCSMSLNVAVVGRPNIILVYSCFNTSIHSHTVSGSSAKSSSWARKCVWISNALPSTYKSRTMALSSSLMQTESSAAMFSASRQLTYIFHGREGRSVNMLSQWYQCYQLPAGQLALSADIHERADTFNNPRKGRQYSFTVRVSEDVHMVLKHVRRLYVIVFLVSSGVMRQSTWYIGHYLAYCTSPRWWMMISVYQSVEWFTA